MVKGSLLMKNEDDRLERIKSIVDRQAHDIPEDFDPENPSIPLARASYGTNEIMEVVESLFSTKLTMGEKVREFEKEWANYLGIENGVMTNSGSSANLIALKAASKDFSVDAEIIVPSVGWSTSVFPILDAGAKPVFVDVDSNNFKVDVESIKSAINDKTEAMVLIHFLGNPADMDQIKDLCDEHDLVLIEDCAQAHGAEFKGQKVGTFGDFGTFSFSFSHHISTIEGGMVVTSSKSYREHLRMLRSWGRVRDIEDDSKFSQERENINQDFLFASHGYNVRPNEIQGALGIHQVERMEDFLEKRRHHAKDMNDRLSSIEDIVLLKERYDKKCSFLHYPILLKEESSHDRDDLRTYLEEKGIETRPLLSGNMTKHPAFKSIESRIEGDLEGANHIQNNGLYISNHHSLSTKEKDYIAKTIKEFFE